MQSTNNTIPGKLMVLGEHAVVYGYPCIVASVNKYITVQAEFSKTEKDEIISTATSDFRFVHSAIDVFRKKYTKNEKLKISIESNLGNYGLGSSSAVTAGTMMSVGRLFGIRIPEKALFDLCFEAVLRVQKNGSGADLASSINGGVIFFDGKSKCTELITSQTLPIVAAFSGVKADTVTMIERVRNERERNPVEVERCFESIENIVNRSKQVIIEQNWPLFGKMMDENQKLLSQLGVSNDTLDRMISAAKSAGALGAKISGAGGGDCIIACVSPEKRRTVMKAIENAGGEVLDIQVG